MSAAFDHAPVGEADIDDVWDEFRARLADVRRRRAAGEPVGRRVDGQRLAAAWRRRDGSTTETGARGAGRGQ